MRAAAIIVAAGRGSRAASERGTKQYIPIAGRTVLERAIAPFIAEPRIRDICVVIRPEDRDQYERAVQSIADRLAPSVPGGETRQQSVLAGLEALAADPPDHVLIHDAARPFVTPGDITSVLEACETSSGAILALPVVDTLKRADDGGAKIVDTVPRAGLWRALTPQGFNYADILAAHQRARRDGRDDFTDDASIAEAYGIDVALVPGDRRNFKITTLEDIEHAEKELRAEMIDVRTGSGFDVHRFCDGDHVWLCGVRVGHDHALEGHSDADVAMHALTDAIYGALADGDIGAHFPPSDPQWKGAASRIFLEHARNRVTARGGRISNVDVTILCEKPKIGPHRDAMRNRLAELLALDITRVAVKATTTERLGFTGRGEGIAAMATATIVLPST